MKMHYAVSLAVLAGFGVGGVTVQAIHAQATPPAYVINEIEVTDPAGYAKFMEGTTVAVPAAGGRFIARGGRTFVVTGAPPKRITLVQFESYEKAQAFFNSDAYKQLVPIRDKSSNFRAFVVEGVSN
jgi:uncharacterized protein (DUF1330 family)